jgi:thiol:disulfide interchange protein DsbA
MSRLMTSLFALLLSVSASAQSLFQEGTHYTTLRQAQPTPATDQVEVLEIFSYTCIQCHHLAGPLAGWEAEKPKDAALRYLHVAWPGAIHYARAFFALEAMAALKSTHVPLFESIFVGNNRYQTLEEIGDFVASKGVDRAKFLATADSFSVNTRLKQAEQAMVRYEVEGTPTVIVAGKYKVQFGVAVPWPKVGEVINFLVEKELAARGSAQTPASG